MPRWTSFRWRVYQRLYLNRLWLRSGRKSPAPGIICSQLSLRSVAQVNTYVCLYLLLLNVVCLFVCIYGCARGCTCMYMFAWFKFMEGYIQTKFVLHQFKHKILNSDLEHFQVSVYGHTIHITFIHVSIWQRHTSYFMIDKCFLPPIENGCWNTSDNGTKVNHDTSHSYSCDEGHTHKGSTTVQCDNGRIIPLPICAPSKWP